MPAPTQWLSALALPVPEPGMAEAEPFSAPDGLPPAGLVPPRFIVLWHLKL